MTKIGVIATNYKILDTAIQIITDLGMEDRTIARLGNMESGVVVARELAASGAEVIIARGGTSALIMKSDVTLPLVEIPIDGRDLAIAVQEAKRLTGKENPRLAALAFSSMRYFLSAFAMLAGIEISLYEFGTSGETLEGVVKRAVADGAEALLGGVMSSEIAAAHGIHGVVIGTSGESLRTALIEAEKAASTHRLEETRVRRMQLVLDLFPNAVIAVDHNRRIQLANPSACRLLGLSQDAMGTPADQALPDIDLEPCLARGEMTQGEIVPFKSTSLVMSATPIRVRGEITGAVVSLQEASRIRELEAKLRNELFAKGLTAVHRFEGIKGGSTLMRDTIAKAKVYAATRGTILITGETGTGKELFAQSIHNASPCRQGPFVAVNCAALPPSLLESELFGYEEGAFTGAMRNGKPGFFELAHGGSIFLDEISEIDRYGQTRLLRILQERRSMRLGGNRYIQLDVRVIAASNRDLVELVERGDFREDLYYRLTALTLHLPPLRLRPGDIPELARFFASACLGTVGGEPHFTPEASAYLERCPWPGNVRELQNIVERLCLFYEGKPFTLEAVREAVEGDAWGAPARPAPRSGTGSDEKSAIVEALRATSGNQRRAAELLGIDPSTLYRKMRRLGIKKVVTD